MVSLLSSDRFIRQNLLLEREALGVLQMVEQATWSSHHDVRPLGKGDSLRDHVHTSHQRRALDVDDAT